MGEDQRLFTVHTDALTRRSRFLKAARSEMWTEIDKPTLLDDHDCDTFHLYLHCVYKDAIPDLQLKPEDGPEQLANETFTALIKLYALADKLQDLASANLAIDEISRFSEIEDVVPSKPALDLAYATTPPGSTLRRLLVDLYFYDACSDKIAADAEDFPKDMMVEFIRAYAASLNTSRSTLNAAREAQCFYHLHDEAHRTCDG